MESESNLAGMNAEELAKCLHAGIILKAYKGSIEDMEVVEVKRKPDEIKKNPNSQESTRQAFTTKREIGEVQAQVEPRKDG